MMADVISMAEHRVVPHLSGRARCCACRHEWVAVAVVGTTWLECPGCGTNKGRYLNDVVPSDPAGWWQCGCGCDVFRVTRAAIYCIDCGKEQVFP